MQNVICVVIPAYKVGLHVLEVIARIPPVVSSVFVIDDACPDGSGRLVKAECRDPRVQVLFLQENRGVGGAVMAGYSAAIAAGADIIVKVDGDGQMDPSLIPRFVQPIVDGEADYTKGNRFFDLDTLHEMPRNRLIGNAALSFMAKLSTGYWDIFDPTNGYTAIHADIAKLLPTSKISNRYFFESDVLFRLYVLRALVVDIPMTARYRDEISNLKISQVSVEFLLKHMRNFFKRIFYCYYLRNMSLASLELPLGALLLTFGTCFGIFHWFHSAQLGIPTPAGTVMLAALPIILGLQFLLAFVGYDISSVPRRARHAAIQRLSA